MPLQAALQAAQVAPALAPPEGLTVPRGLEPVPGQQWLPVSHRQPAAPGEQEPVLQSSELQAAQLAPGQVPEERAPGQLVRAQVRSLPPQAVQLARVQAPLERLAAPQGPELAPDRQLPVSRRQPAAPGGRERAPRQLSEPQAPAPALRLAGAARRERVQGPAVWRPGWPPPPAGEAQARAPQ